MLKRGLVFKRPGLDLCLAPDFADKLYVLATPGTTVVVTDEAALQNSNLNIVTMD